MMDKNIVFFDIDGTLVDEETFLIPESTKKAIHDMRKNGHLAFINTGRTVCQIPNIKTAIEFDGIICGCGTYIEYDNKVLLHNSLGKDLSQKLVQAVKKYKLDAALEGIDGVYYDDLEFIKHPEILKVRNIHEQEGVSTSENWYKDDLNIDKLVIFLNEDSDFQGFFNEFKDTLDFIKRAEDFYELVPLNYCKATGIQFIIDYLNIPFENTFAIGDSTNDLTMLQYVKNSIAMGNSNPKLFDFVTFVTKDIKDDGIQHALSHYKMI